MSPLILQLVPRLSDMFFKLTKLMLILNLLLSDASATTSHNCCSLTESELKKLSPTQSCPRGTSLRNFVTRIFSKCGNCPDGTCRINGGCYCPEDFLNSSEQQQRCVDSFNEAWQASIGREDRHRRSCVRPSPKVSDTFDNCCLLSPEQLDLRVGTSNSCPLFRVNSEESVERLVLECLPCPFGTCRVDFMCYCPQDFLKSPYQQGLCVRSFRVPYPESITSQDSRCPENPLPEVLPASIAPDAKISPSPTISPSLTISPSPTTSISSEKLLGNETNVNVEPTSLAFESEDGGGLSGLEKAGIIVGILGGIATFCGFIYGCVRGHIN